MNYSITQLFAKLIYSQFWNIGFTPDKPETVIQNKGVSKINWMKHPYKDRWFADPFVVKEDEVCIFGCWGFFGFREESLFIECEG